MVTHIPSGFKEGIHLYINIKNFDSLSDGIYSEFDKIKHTMHLLHSFVSGITSFISHYNLGNYIFIEKVTGARIHLVLLDQPNLCQNFLKIVKYCYDLLKELNKTKQHACMNDATIQLGAYYGPFELYVFHECLEDSEPTSIGYCANVAAKIQSIVNRNSLGISSNIYSLLTLFGDNNNFIKDDTKQLNKYKVPVYTCCLSEISNNLHCDFSKLIEEECVKSRKIKLCDIKETKPKDVENSLEYSIYNIASFKGTIVCSDVRGFTKSFEKDEFKNSLARDYAKNILNIMYNECAARKNQGAIHLQFQGDKELVLFNEGCENSALEYAMKVSNKIKEQGYHAGIGISFGQIYDCTIGKKSKATNNDKDIMIMGHALNEATYLEDERADKDEIYVNKDFLNKLDTDHKNIFKQEGNFYYVKDALQTYRQYVDAHNNFIEKEKPVKGWKKN